MHVQQLLNILVNRDVHGLTHSLNRLERVTADSSKLTVGPFISLDTQGDFVEPLDIFASLANYSDKRCTVAFFSVCHVIHAGRQIQAGQSEVEDSNAQIYCQYLPFELLQDAALYHWNGRFHSQVYTILGKDAQFYKPHVTVDNLWQFSLADFQKIANATLQACNPSSVPNLPYPSPTDVASCPLLHSTPGSAKIACPFPDCSVTVTHSFLRMHIGGHFILGDRWQGQEKCDGTLFCLFCGNCDGTCVTTYTGGRIESTCNLAYTSLKVTVARKGSKANPCTNVPSPCPLKTCKRWVCSYALVEHVATHRVNMPPPHFKLLPAESQAVLDAFKRSSRHRPVDPSSQRVTDLPLAPAAVTNCSASSGSGSGSGGVIFSSSSSSGSSNSSSSSSSSNSSSSATSQSEFVPSEDVSDTGATTVHTRSAATKRPRVVRTVASMFRKRPKGKERAPRGLDLSDSDGKYIKQEHNLRSSWDRCCIKGRWTASLPFCIVAGCQGGRQTCAEWSAPP